MEIEHSFFANHIILTCERNPQQTQKQTIDDDSTMGWRSMSSPTHLLWQATYYWVLTQAFFVMFSISLRFHWLNRSSVWGIVIKKPFCIFPAELRHSHKKMAGIFQTNIKRIEKNFKIQNIVLTLIIKINKNPQNSLIVKTFVKTFFRNFPFNIYF